MREVKEIRKFFLPEQTNKLYTDEAINSINLTREVAAKINELVEAYNEIGKTSLQERQDLEGKINKAILYLKENLKNSIHELLEVMADNGDIEGIVDTLIPVILEEKYTFAPVDAENILGVSTVVDFRYPYGHVRRYGAKGDGKTDDSKAFETAITVCKQGGFTLQADAADYLLRKEVDARHVHSISIRGNIINTSNAKFIVGSYSNLTDPINVEIQRVSYLRGIGFKNSKIDVGYCDELELFADGDVLEDKSIGYNTISGGYCGTVKITSVGGVNGWVNENKFTIKRIDEIIIDGEYGNNANYFDDCTLERGKLRLINARNNHFSARGEGGIDVYLEGETEANFIRQDYYYNAYFGKPIEEEGKGNIKYYPVHMLQTEEELLRIDKHHKDHPVGVLSFSSNGKFYGTNYGGIFTSDLVPLNNTIAIKLNASHAAVRARVNFFDRKGNRITTPVNCITDGNMGYREDGDYSYTIAANVASDTVILMPDKDVAYFTYSVIFGNEILNTPLDYVSIKLIKYVNTDVNIVNTVPFNVYTGVPEKGYWTKGTVLWAANPKAGEYAGIICVADGTPGTWRNFAPIKFD